MNSRVLQQLRLLEYFFFFIFLHLLLHSLLFRSTQQSTICKHVAGACSKRIEDKKLYLSICHVSILLRTLHSTIVCMATVRRRCNRVMRLYTRARPAQISVARLRVHWLAGAVSELGTYRYHISNYTVWRCKDNKTVDCWMSKRRKNKKLAKEDEETTIHTPIYVEMVLNDSDDDNDDDILLVHVQQSSIA